MRRFEERAPDPGRPRRLRPAPGPLALAERAAPRLRLLPDRPLLPRGLLASGGRADVAAGDPRLALTAGAGRGARQARAVPPPYVGRYIGMQHCRSSQSQLRRIPMY